MTKSGYKHIAALILLNAFAQLCFAQVNVRATISRGKILIGEPITLTVEAYMPLGIDFSWFRADSIPSFEITNISQVDTIENIDGKKLIQTLVVTSFDSGTQYVPPFQILVNNESFYTDSIPVEVSFTPFDRNSDYRDIKDIIEVSNPAAKNIPYYIAALAILSLAGLIFLLRKKRSNLTPVKSDLPVLTPYEEAMNTLNALKKRYTAHDEIKSYYSDLNDVLRKYLSREYRIATFERTNEELIMQMSKLSLSRDVYISLAQSLRMSDFVKFAKYTPAESDNLQNLENVKTSIELLNKKVSGAV